MRMGLSLVVIAMAGVADAQVNRVQTDSNIFQVLGPGSSTFRQQSERFKDPRQRAAVKAEQRASILETHRDIGVLLQIDPAIEHELVELLAEVQTSDLERFYTSATANPTPGDQWDSLYAHAQRETEKVQALRELLGQEKLERYKTFATLVNEYRQVAKLDARLAPAHKLNLDQKQRMAELWRDHTRSQIEGDRISMHSHGRFGFSLGQPMPSREELQRQSQLTTITANEASWRRMPKADEELGKRAAEFLDPMQLNALAEMNAERADSLRQWIENARVQAGLSPQIPAEPEVTPPPAPIPVAGDVKVAIKIAINRGEATHYTDTVRNGGAVAFPCAEGLFVEARPTVYDNDVFDVRLFYYEPDSRGGRRLIGEGVQMGRVIKGSESSGAGGSVVTGNKGYAIQTSVQVEPV